MELFLITLVVRSSSSRLREHGSKCFARIGEAEFALSEKISNTLSEKEQIPEKAVLGCRPEHMKIADSGSAGIPAVVDVNEMLGSEIHAHLNCADKSIIVRIPTTDLPEEHHRGFAPGTALKVQFQPELIHLFDPETEKNLF